LLRGDDVICYVIKNAVYRQRQHLTKAFQKEKHDTASPIAERICEQKLELSLIKSLSKKTEKKLFCLVADVTQPDHAVIVQFSGVAPS